MTQYRIKPARELLMGDLGAGVGINDEGHAYISLGRLGEEEERLSIDAIEAFALREWLDGVLQKEDDK